MSRHSRQEKVARWVRDAFGLAHAQSTPQRAVRFLEEAIELNQAVFASAYNDDAAALDQARAMAHQLVDHVFDRPAGSIGQELGGVGVTVLALAAAAGYDADTCEIEEVLRVTSKPLAHFHARNEAKNAAGFDVTGGAYPTAPKIVAEELTADEVAAFFPGMAIEEANRQLRALGDQAGFTVKTATDQDIDHMLNHEEADDGAQNPA
ncbi:MAG TPA: hypothetical protein VJP88_08725 [Caulobacteraceae bacterium]|nr:hypothetical protein [Caulobacteraceae bacterium]